MTSRERVCRSVFFEDLDRLPTAMYATTVEYETRIANRCGWAKLEPMYRELGIDVWRNRELPVYIGAGRNNVCEGRPWAECHSVDEVEEFPFPTGADFDTTDMVRELRDHREFATITGTIPEGYTGGLYHLYLDMCGQENGFVFLRQQPEVARAMIRRITDYWVSYAKRVLDSWPYLDIFQNASDFGTQRGMAISPEDFREFFKPGIARLCSLVKSYGAMFMHHSCGAIEPIISDLIAIGVDILNPIQTTAVGMDIEILKDKYWGKIAFFGGIDTQWLLPRGPEKKIREEVRRLKALFPTGYILCAAQELADDIPLGHSIAIFDENMKRQEATDGRMDRV